MRRCGRPLRSTSLLLALGIFLGGACDNSPDPGAAPGQPTPSSPVKGATSSTEAPAEQKEVRAYFLRDERVGPVARRATGGDVATGAVEGLLAGPTSTEQDLGLSTAIPEGTTLFGVAVDNRVATVDLSERFASGGGSASMQARVAQVVFTLTQFPTVDAVSFQIDGEPLTVLGGEGVSLERTQERVDWEDLSPVILVESPMPSATVASPLRLTGTANTFEAVFWVRVTDGEGAVVYDHRAMATSGTGTRGTFDITASFERAAPGIGTVTVFEKSPKDGEPTHTVEIPVRFVDH